MTYDIQAQKETLKVPVLPPLTHQNMQLHEMVVSVKFRGPQTNGAQKILKKLKLVPTSIEKHRNHYKCTSVRRARRTNSTDEAAVHV